MQRRYQINTLVPYINWPYFFYAWKVKEDSNEGKALKKDALAMLNRLDRHYRISATVQLFWCNSDGDDIVLVLPSDCPCPSCKANPVVIKRLPMLRQQKPGQNGYCMCLSDFIRPKGTGLQDKIGVFAVSADKAMPELYGTDDPYNQMLVQTLSDRLAEAGAECLHEEVRKSIWGYAPDENLSIEDMHLEKFVGIRPAVGYPCLPDISLNFIIDELIDFKSIGVELTDNGMMVPHASVSGLMFRHPLAHYFSIGRIDGEQLADYARRREMNVDEMRKYLQGNVM